MERLMQHLRLTFTYIKRRRTAFLEVTSFSLLAVGLLTIVSTVALSRVPPPLVTFILGAWVGVGYANLYSWTRPFRFRNLKGYVTAFYKTMTWPLALILEDKREEALRLLRFFELTLLFLAAAAFAGSGPPVDELPAFQREIYSLVLPFAVMYLMVRIAIPLVPDLNRILSILFTLLVSYLLLTGAYKRFADDADALVRFVAAHPAESLTVALTLWAFTFFYQTVSRVTRSRYIQLDPAAVRPLGVATLPPLITERDERVMAVHEAGHVFAYLLVEPKEDLSTALQGVSASIRPNATSLGRVQNEREEAHRLRTEGELEWLMLRVLAGRAAELTLLGESYSGSQGDTANWSHWASIYLGNGFGEELYDQPEDEAQRRYNAGVFHRLREKQLVYLRAFLERNRDILEELAHTLQQEKELDSQALQAFLSKRDIDIEEGGKE